MNGTIFFISDTHFKYKINDDAEAAKRRLFLRFLDEIEGAGRLYLVGDIFDFWFEYGGLIPGYFSDVLCGLRRLRESGTEILITGGNHDHWLGPALTDGFGVEVLEPEVTHHLQGRTVTITHGDTVMPGDHGYKLLKSFIRSRPVIALARLVHPSLLYSFAHWFSARSKGLTDAKTSKYAEKIVDIAEDALFSRGNDVFVMGHVHLPVIRDYGSRTLVILGDWEKYFSYLRMEGGLLSLERYQSEG